MMKYFIGLFNGTKSQTAALETAKLHLIGHLSIISHTQHHNVSKLLRYSSFKVHGVDRG